MLREAGDYYYLAQSECLHIEGVSDAAHLQQTVNAMNIMGLTPDEQMDMFAVIAAVLHLGNVRFYEGRGEAAQLEPEESDADEAWGKEKRCVSILHWSHSLRVLAHTRSSLMCACTEDKDRRTV
jgi:hypothetical protein